MSQIENSNDEKTATTILKTTKTMAEGDDCFRLSKTSNNGNSSWVEMLENEKTDLVHRIGNLERKVDEQNDEIVCLRGSLADTLRRISLLEATLAATTISSSRQSTAAASPSQPVVVTLGARSMTRSTPSHLALGRSLNVAQNNVLYSPATALTDSHVGFHQKLLNMSNTSTPSPPPLPLSVRNRCRLSVHESSNSLNSSSIESSNDSNDSQYRNHSATPSSAVAQNSTSFNNRNGLCSAKRWNSTGDFNHNHVLLSPASSTSTVSRFSTSTKSLLNLNSRSNIKHGTKESIYNRDGGCVTTYFRDKPITFQIPTEYLNNNSYDICKVQRAPNFKIELDWVYGYRGRDCRSNLQLLPTGELIYFVSTVVVLYNAEDQQQRHYLEHTDDIKCISIHPKKLLIASGQAASSSYNKLTKAHIRIWNSVNLLTLAVIGFDYFQASVTCLSFSKFDGGNLLAAVDESSEHVITLWSWQSGQRLAENKCLSETVLVVEFHPFDNSVLVTCGKTHVNFWSIDLNNTLYKRMGTFEMREKPKYVTCVAFTQSGEIVTGDSNGNLLFWTKNVNKFQRIIKKVHNGALFSICALRDGSFVTGGGKDGRVVQFSSQWIRTGNEIQIEQHFGGVRVIVEGRGSQFFIGTTRNCILSGSFSMGIQPIVLGHTDELFALASHPKLSQFVTGGFDHLLQMWDSLSHNVVWSKEMNHAIYSVAFSHFNDQSDDFVVAVGCSSGQWIVLDALTREIVASGCDGSDPLLCVQFSPNNQLLAFGSADHSVYVYEVSNSGHKYVKVNKCSGHTSGVIKLDWSQDSLYFRTNGTDYEMFTWNAKTCRQVMNESLGSDMVWATNNCILSFESFGALPENIQEPMTICCAAATSNPKSKLLLSGDESGALKLYVYPAVQPKSLAVATKIHRNEVSNVTFLRDEMRAISIGACDTLVAQWNIVAVIANFT